MNSDYLFDFLQTVNRRPVVFSRYTASDLWADDHTSTQMLQHHLDVDNDLASRRGSFIDKSVDWIAERFQLSAGNKVIDFGCGPGLYCSRLARRGVDVVGIDFSARSIGYARNEARDNNLSIDYVQANYLEYSSSETYDLILLVMMDFCALSPAQRESLLKTFASLLSAGGRIVLDVYSAQEFSAREEGFDCDRGQPGSLWSADPHYVFVSRFKYFTEVVSLDWYTIVQEGRRREVYNWLQYFTPQTLSAEARSAGLVVDELYGDVAGGPYDADATEFAVVLKRNI